MVKKERQPTAKQGRFLLSRLEGKNQEQSLREAGYKSKGVDASLKKSAEHLLLTAMSEVGITPYLISEKLHEGFEATKVDRQGEAHPDYDVRLKYIRTVMELLGLNKTLKVDVSVEHKNSVMDKEELQRLITIGTAEELQKLLAEQSVIDAEDAEFTEKS